MAKVTVVFEDKAEGGMTVIVHSEPAFPDRAQMTTAQLVSDDFLQAALRVLESPPAIVKWEAPARG